MKYLSFLLPVLVLAATVLLSAFAPALPFYPLTLLGKLPQVVKESSGLEAADKPGTYWTHNDAGNTPELFKINEKGQLLAQITIQETQNNDWEDLTQDTKGYLYIADTGNNKSKRHELAVYKVSPKKGYKAQVIRFGYQDHPTGKIPKKERNFDCEAIFWHNQKLYLISKDRGTGRNAKLYQLPDQPGKHTAKLIGKTQLSGMVTSADLSPNARQLAVLTQSAIYLFPVPKNSTQFLSAKPKTIALKNTGQVEAITFKDNKTILISNEEGNLFKYSL